MSASSAGCDYDRALVPPTGRSPLRGDGVRHGARDAASRRRTSIRRGRVAARGRHARDRERLFRPFINLLAPRSRWSRPGRSGGMPASAALASATVSAILAVPVVVQSQSGRPPATRRRLALRLALVRLALRAGASRAATHRERSCAGRAQSTKLTDIVPGAWLSARRSSCSPAGPAIGSQAGGSPARRCRLALVPAQGGRRRDPCPGSAAASGRVACRARRRPHRRRPHLDRGLPGRTRRYPGRQRRRRDARVAHRDVAPGGGVPGRHRGAVSRRPRRESRQRSPAPRPSPTSPPPRLPEARQGACFAYTTRPTSRSPRRRWGSGARLATAGHRRLQVACAAVIGLVRRATGSSHAERPVATAARRSSRRCSSSRPPVEARRRWVRPRGTGTRVRSRRVSAAVVRLAIVGRAASTVDER